MKMLAEPEESRTPAAVGVMHGSATAGTQETQADLRLRREQERVAEVEDREPLRRRLLVALAESPATPTGLANELKSPKESVSRQLRDLREAGLVEVQRVVDDRRLRRYSLTADGELALSEHRAFGEAEGRPAAPSSAEMAESLRSALLSAVKMRRRSNRLEEATDRLRLIVNQADEADASDVAVDAVAELTTTLRQSRKLDEADDLLERLLKTASVPGDCTPLALAASAHHDYALGRLGSRRGEDLSARECHLKDAAALYKYLSRSGEKRTSEWLERRAWSVVSVAGNLRKQWRLAESLKEAEFAKSLFEELDDPYGLSYSHFMRGFCLRLLGGLDEAWDCLTHAYELAEKNQFERFQADSLMQMGEVRRCQGNLTEAQQLLGEASSRSERMTLLVTQAFAQSALGAVEYQQEQWPAAEAALRCAQEIFESCDHAEGLALNARRRATATRQAAAAAKRRDLREVERLIRSAFERYKRLSSPAGIAACEIERGRVQMIRSDGKRSPGAVKKLKALLANYHLRGLLEQDLWVPRVLDAFAREIDDEDLTIKVEQVRLSAAQRLEDRVAQGVRQIPELTGGSRGDEEEGVVLLAEMGGETQRDQAHEGALAA